MNLRIICIISAWCTVTGQLPADVLPINKYMSTGNHLFTKLTGAHGMIQVDNEFYIPCKNQVNLLRILPSGLSQSMRHDVTEVIHWPSAATTSQLCKQKTSYVDACNNYIRVFVPKDEKNTDFVICGTNSLRPICRTYVKSNASFSMQSEFSGTSICPYDPRHTGTSIYTDGNVYSATVTDFLGRKPVIHRYSEDTPSKHLMEKRDDTWLSDPSFVRLVDADRKVYIFYTEVGMEDRSGLTYSRVGQVCKNDQGGNHILRKQFTTFQKSRLNCSFPGVPPFYFNEISAISDFVQLPDSSGENVIFAAMNTPTNSIWGSAVCAYLQRDIEETFAMPFLEKQTGVDGVTYWSRKEGDKAVNDALNRCEYDNSGARSYGLSNENLLFIRTHALKSGSVPSWSGQGKKSIPLFMKLNSRYQFSAITVDTNAGSAGLDVVLLIGTTDGRILKIVPRLSSSPANSYDDSVQFVEETLAYDKTNCSDGTEEHNSLVRDIKIDKSTGYIMVVFVNCIVSIPMCPVTSSCQRSCIAAQNPYCAWDGEKCVTVLKPEGLEQDVLHGDVTGLPSCPVVPPPDGKTSASNKSDSTVEGGASNSGAMDKITTTGAPGTLSMTSRPLNHTSLTQIGLAGALPNALIGFVIGVSVTALLFIVCCLCKKNKKKSKLKQEDLDKNKNAAHERKTSHESTKASQQVPVNHSRGKKSESSYDDASSPFLEDPRDNMDGNRSSTTKVKSGRKDSNRKSNGSYHRQDSLEKNAHQTIVTRQTSRESNPEMPKENSHSNDENFSSSDQYQHPGTSAQQQNFHRTYSVGNSATTPHNHRALQRNLSLQMPPPQQQQPQPYFHNLTPMPYRGQNPLEIYNQSHINRDMPTAAPPWHTTKSMQEAGRQYQTTSLDRKALKSRSFNQGQNTHPQNGPPPVRNFSDTLPSQARDDMQGPMRKRYQSESMSGRAPPLFYASKHPMYTSIEEENLPMTEQNHMNDELKAPPLNSMMRPSHLTLMKPNEQRLPEPSKGFMVPYSNPTTPMAEHPPFFVQSPQRASGHTLPPQVLRQYSEISPVKYAKQTTPLHLMSPHRPMHDITEDQFPYLATQRAMNSEFANLQPKGEKQSKSNPATPEWDQEKGDMFPSAMVSPSDRHRNPSGKSQATPSSPVKQFPGFGHPDVIPSKINNRVMEEPSHPEKLNMGLKNRSNERINTNLETVM